MVSFEKRHKLFQDKTQARFTKEGEVKQPEEKKKAQFTELHFNETVACPFCLYTAKLSHFLISGSKGFQQGMASCPDCKHGMRMSSLYNDWTPEQYAKWVYDYVSSGFWSKCPFEKWKSRLQQLGWARRFWDEYKRLKAQYSVDDTLEMGARTADEYEKLADEYEASFNK